SSENSVRVLSTASRRYRGACPWRAYRDVFRDTSWRAELLYPPPRPDVTRVRLESGARAEPRGERNHCGIVDAVLGTGREHRHSRNCRGALAQPPVRRNAAGEDDGREPGIFRGAP